MKRATSRTSTIATAMMPPVPNATMSNLHRPEDAMVHHDGTRYKRPPRNHLTPPAGSSVEVRMDTGGPWWHHRSAQRRTVRTR
jgi:hypothetical protein